MAQFIFGNFLRDRINRYRWLRATIWFVEWLLIKGVSLLTACLPTKTASNLGYQLGIKLGPRVEKNNAFKRNIQRAFTDKTAAQQAHILREAWGNAGRVFAEYPHLRDIIRDSLEIQVLGDPAVFRQPDRCAVFVCAHYSNWEFAAAAVAKQGVAISCLYSPLTNPWLDRLMSHYRQSLGCDLLAKDESIRTLVHQLQRGHSLGFVIDQRVDSGAPINFFGMPKYSTLVPARLALRHHCELIAIHIERIKPGGYRATFHPPITVPNDKMNEKERAIAMTEQVHQLFEQWIRERPEDWFCSKRRWPKQETGNGKQETGNGC